MFFKETKFTRLQGARQFDSFLLIHKNDRIIQRYAHNKQQQTPY